MLTFDFDHNVLGGFILVTKSVSSARSRGDDVVYIGTRSRFLYASRESTARGLDYDRVVLRLKRVMFVVVHNKSFGERFSARREEVRAIRSKTRE